MRRFVVFFAVLAVVATPLVALAKDVIYKVDGGKLKGDILRESRSSVTIRTLGGTVTVPRTEIAKVERDGDIFRAFDEKKAKLEKRPSAEGWFEFGTWCQQQGLYPEAIDAFHETLALDSDHDDARWELGYRRLAGRWVTTNEYFEAKGFVRYQGRWVTPAEKENLEAGLVEVDGQWVRAEDVELDDAPVASARREERRERPTRSEPERPRSGGATSEREKKPAPRDPAERWRGGAGAPLGGQDGPPLSEDERDAQLEANKQQGGWQIGYKSKYYDFYSNGDMDEVKLWAAIMDLMCEEYIKIFKFEGEITRPFPILLYGSQQEFMSKTNNGPGVGGFYDGRKIVAYHKDQGGGHGTLSTLFHEGTHQFQGLVMGQNMWRAQIWLIEGLAVFFEASEAQGKRLRTGTIPKDRLAHVKRAMNGGQFVPLATLIRMEQAQFGALHYAHAWSLIYFLVNGTKGGKKRFIEYWEQVKGGHPDQVGLFEELFNKPIDEIEAAWKSYVQGL
ncbi:MAG: DUF1570 domain-containing protein [Planctomycetota bacterium]